MKAKLMSRQAVQVAAGYSDTDFHVSDEEGQRCGEINQKAIDWALENASSAALKRYQEKGEEMILGDDMGPYNEGPLWIWTYMKYAENSDKTQETVQSAMMRTPVDYPISLQLDSTTVRFYHHSTSWSGCMLIVSMLKTVSKTNNLSKSFSCNEFKCMYF